MAKMSTGVVSLLVVLLLVAVSVNCHTVAAAENELTEESSVFSGTALLRDGDVVLSGCDCSDDWRLVPLTPFVIQQRRDGNFLVYTGSPEANSSRLLWSTNATGPEGDYATTFRSDCHLVTRSVNNDTLFGDILWSSSSVAEEEPESPDVNGTISCMLWLTVDWTHVQILKFDAGNETLIFSAEIQPTPEPTTAPGGDEATLEPTSPQRPNILLITTDDMNFDSVGVYGCPVDDTTPHIDKLASEGLQFDYGFVNIAVCTPSRHVILSGSHSHQTATRGFTDIERVGPTLPDVLRDHGYYTVQVNKQQHVYNWHKSYNEAHTAWGRQVSYHRSLMRDIIRQAGVQPWLTVFNLNDPHRAFHGAPDEAKYRPELYRRFSTPSRVYNASEIVVPGFLPDLSDVRTEIAQYYSSVRRADDNVGAILDSLDQMGQTNETIVVFLSDHGMSNPFAKLSCYQNSLRVPFLFRFPGFIQAGRRDKKNMVSAVDLAPTLLELVGIEVPSTMAGRSFAPLLEGKTQEGRDHVFGYYYRNTDKLEMYPMFVVQSRNWVYIYSPWVDGKKQVSNSDFGPGITLKAMWEAAETIPSIQRRTEFHKYRIRHELYNVRQDPQAYSNVAYEAENDERVKSMRQLLVDWMEATDHPAKELMMDPDNEDKIADYMRWEELNAIAENLEQNFTVDISPSGVISRSCLVALAWVLVAGKLVVL